MQYELQFLSRGGDLEGTWQPQRQITGEVVRGELRYVLSALVPAQTPDDYLVEMRIVEDYPMRPTRWWRKPRIVKRVILRRDRKGVMHGF